MEHNQEVTLLKFIMKLVQRYWCTSILQRCWICIAAASRPVQKARQILHHASFVLSK